MNVSVLIGTCGDRRWQTLARERAWPSAFAQRGTQLADVKTRHEPEKTLAQVRNQLARESTWDWLCFLDADDELAPGYLDAMNLALHRFKSGQPICDVMTESGPRPTRVRPLAPHALLVPSVSYVHPGGTHSAPTIPAWGQPLIEINCACIGTLIPRDLFLAIGGFREFPLYEDWDLWLRAVLAGAELVPVPEAVYRAHVSPTGRNVQPSRASNTYWQIRREHEPAWERRTRCGYSAS